MSRRYRGESTEEWQHIVDDEPARSRPEPDDEPCRCEVCGEYIRPYVHICDACRTAAIQKRLTGDVDRVMRLLEVGL